MNLITLRRLEEHPHCLFAEFHQGGMGWQLLKTDDLRDAVHEAAGLAGLDEEFRDEQGEEWDILIPEQTQFRELPDGEVVDYWCQRGEWNRRREARNRERQAFVAELQMRRVNRPPPPFASRKPPASKRKPPVGSEGICYFVRWPEGWSFRPIRVDWFPIEDFSHAEFWEELLAGFMAERWQPEVSQRFTTVEQLRDELLPLAYAFPRGRVVSLGRTFGVYHGDNLAAFMGSDRKAIESGFDIHGNAQWEFDEYDQSVAHHRDQLRALLGLTETWSAV